MAEIRIEKCEYKEILLLRGLYLQENNFQIRYDACHVRNWADEYLILLEGNPIGYASTKGLIELKDRDTLFELYILPAFRNYSRRIIQLIAETAQLTHMESQSNDLLTSSMLYECCKNIKSEVVLFQDHTQTNWEKPAVEFRKREKDECIPGKADEDMGAYVLLKDKAIIATGGFLLHYNKPFADLYMEVASDFRGKGYAKYILQEIKKECFKAGRIPSARCNISNPASKGALLGAGMKIAGYMLQGKIK